MLTVSSSATELPPPFLALDPALYHADVERMHLIAELAYGGGGGTRPSPSRASPKETDPHTADGESWRNAALGSPRLPSASSPPC